MDATPLPMFHQREALVVDKNVTMVDLKSTIMQFVKAYFGPETKVRFRPSFFPFTEPSAEVDVWFEDRQKWIELGGCGMVHPNVLKAVNVDPEEYSGWAFGFGIERIAMRKYGITDIRLFVENGVRFLRQFLGDFARLALQEPAFPNPRLAIGLPVAYNPAPRRTGRPRTA